MMNIVTVLSIKIVFEIFKIFKFPFKISVPNFMKNLKRKKREKRATTGRYRNI